MDVTANGHWGADLRHVGLVDEDLLGLSAKMCESHSAELLTFSERARTSDSGRGLHSSRVAICLSTAIISVMLC